MKFWQKLLLLLLIFGPTFFYANYQKQLFLENPQSNAVILKKMPAFTAINLENNTSFSREMLLIDERTEIVIVHFWASWCGPCEAEFPSLLNLAKSLSSDQRFKFLLIAVRDQELKIRKFLSQLGEIPNNIILLHSVDGQVLTQFGSVKVPETYVFNKGGTTLRKYVGPQEWNKFEFIEELKSYLAAKSI